MGSLTTEYGEAGDLAVLVVYRIAAASGAARWSAQRYAERVEAWEDEGGALPGGAAAGGIRAETVAPDSAC